MHHILNALCTALDSTGAPLFGNDHNHCCDDQCPPLAPLRGLTLIIHEAAYAIAQQAEKCFTQKLDKCCPTPRLRVEAEFKQGELRCVGKTSAHSTKKGETVRWSEFVNVNGASRRKEQEKLSSMADAKKNLKRLQDAKGPGAEKPDLDSVIHKILQDSFQRKDRISREELCKDGHMEKLDQ